MLMSEKKLRDAIKFKLTKNVLSEIKIKIKDESSFSKRGGKYVLNPRERDPLIKRFKKLKRKYKKSDDMGKYILDVVKLLEKTTFIGQKDKKTKKVQKFKLTDSPAKKIYDMYLAIAEVMYTSNESLDMIKADARNSVSGMDKELERGKADIKSKSGVTRRGRLDFKEPTTGVRVRMTNWTFEDPMTGKTLKFKDVKEFEDWLFKRQQITKKQKGKRDYYAKMGGQTPKQARQSGKKDDNKKSDDPLKKRTSYYGGLDFDKFFKDILDGKKLLKKGQKHKAGSHGWNQIVAVQTLYNDIFPNAKIEVDGEFGSGTRKAIIKLQKHAKTFGGEFAKTTVDGIIGRQTIAIFDPRKGALPITGAKLKKVEKAIDDAK